jgi:hypothetical protein
VAVATKRNTFFNFFLYPVPAVSLIDHFGYGEILIAYVVKLKDAMIG